MNTTDQHTGAFVKTQAAGHLPGGPQISALRKDAIQRFSELGFPTTKHEEWKYTNVAPILKNDYHLEASSAFLLKQEDIRPFLMAGKDCFLFVFENGTFNPALSIIEGLPKGVVAGDLAAHLDHPVVAEHLAKYASFTKESFVALNTAFVHHGAFLYVPANTVLEKPIHFLNICDTRDRALLMNPRNLFIAEKNSKAVVIESYHSVGEVNPSFTNSVTESVVKENASLELIKLQLESEEAFHIGHTEAMQSRDSNFNISTVTIGGAIVRNNLHIVLNGENATAHLYGLYVVHGKELVDNHTLVDHAKPNCYSNELYKGVLDGDSQGVFNGKIFVRQDAQKTNAYQSNKNILLSDNASMNAKPQLEIFADDVKCSHGATTGQLDHEALFYLRSRGIGEKTAKAFLNIAFAADVLNKISVETLRDRLIHLVEEKLKK
jgi:Fe-S cluster assembly protein SufD